MLTLCSTKLYSDRSQLSTKNNQHRRKWTTKLIQIFWSV